MLHLESMDHDTETRRVSPVAILGDGYVDLVNGPQDHGWCAGYTCQERLSLFPIVLAAGKALMIRKIDYDILNKLIDRLIRKLLDQEIF